MGIVYSFIALALMLVVVAGINGGVAWHKAVKGGVRWYPASVRKVYTGQDAFALRSTA